MGAPVTHQGIRYRCISAVVCRRMINQSKPMDAPRIYIELELLDNGGHSVTLANPRDVDVVDEEMFAAAVRAKNAQYGGKEIEHPAEEAKETEVEQKPKRKRFVKPTESEVLEYCAEKGYTHVDVDAFMAHYESVGWHVGKNHMVSWHAAVTGWETRAKKETVGREGQETRESASSFATDAFFAAAVRRSDEEEG